MDGTNFRLVVEEVETWKSPYAAVTCVVEGGSISVDDYVCLNHANGKTIKARVERIMVAPGLELRTAEPGKVVWLVLCGRKVKQIRKRRCSETACSRAEQVFKNSWSYRCDPRHPSDRQSKQYCDQSGYGMAGQYI